MHNSPEPVLIPLGSCLRKSPSNRINSRSASKANSRSPVSVIGGASPSNVQSLSGPKPAVSCDASSGSVNLDKAFAETAKLRGELKPSFDINLSWKQDPMTQDLAFNDGTGHVGLEMKGVLDARITDRIRFEGWLAGGGSVTVGAPAPFARSLDFSFEPGVRLKIDNLFGGTAFKASIAYQCTWTPANGEASCSSGDSSSNLSLIGGSFTPHLQLICPHYKEFGNYESFKRPSKAAGTHLGKDASPQMAAADGTIVSNVFPGAEPTILPVRSNGKMLLWVRQNPNLPVLQSTDIAWSYND